MKKRTVLALACILALSMAACGNKQGGQGGGSKTESEAKRVPKVEPYTAVDKEDYAIRVDGIEVDEDGYYSIQLTFENKSKDKEFNFSLDSLSGDGIRLDLRQPHGHGPLRRRHRQPRPEQRGGDRDDVVARQQLNELRRDCGRPGAGRFTWSHDSRLSADPLCGSHGRYSVLGSGRAALG